MGPLLLSIVLTLVFMKVVSMSNKRLLKRRKEILPGDLAQPPRPREEAPALTAFTP